MSHGWSYIPGEWTVYCDVCQRAIKASESKHRWDGLIVCSDDFEYRHPHDFIKVKPERHGVPFSRPEPADVFVDITGEAYLYVFEEYIEDQDNYVERSNVL